MTSVVHVHNEYDVYIGRRCGKHPYSIWANPFKIGKDGDRDEVIAKYREWVQKQPTLMSRIHELKGKRLGCWCAPDACHGDVLKDLADAT